MTTTSALAPAALSVVEVQGILEEGAFRVRLVMDTSEENPMSNVDGADGAKWTARYEGLRYVGEYLLNDAFNEFTVVFALPGVVEPGDNFVSYSNAPSDITDVIGRMLMAFTRPLA